MAHRTVLRLACLVTLLAVTSSAKKEQSRWSRQISTYTSDISDWVPLSGPVEREEPVQPTPIKRQAVAEPRILSEPFPGFTRPTGFGQDSFPSRNFYNSPANRQLYLQSVPSAPQNYLTDQGFGQGIRFGLSQPNFPLNQGFVAPPFGFDNIQQQKPRPPSILNPVSFNQALPGPSQAKPFLNQTPKLEVPRLVDGYRAENVSNDFGFNVMKKPQSLQKIKFDTIDKPIKPDAMSQNSKNEREEVQLLYVPLESLNRGQFNFRTPMTTSQLLNTELYSQGSARPNPQKQAFINDYQRPVAKPHEILPGPNYFSDFNSQLKDIDQVPKYSTLPTPFPTLPQTTPKPKKLKPHQPPLAIFMTKEVSKNSQVKVGDVLSSLKNADTIAVLDSVNPLNAPKVFIGPSTLPPPDNFVKFELPYLSNIENVDKKLKQLPFFVAPLSYNTPNGFAKIPFPSPHVGSVVINSQIRDSPQTQATIQPGHVPNYYATQPTYKPEKPATQKPTFSYYSTSAPKPNTMPNHQSNYYSFEPQTVSSIKPPQPETATAPPKTGSYFISNRAPQYNSQDYNFAHQNSFKSSEVVDQYNFQRKPDHTTTLRTTTTTTTTTKPPSTYPSQLLETHNPYSINQAFHFSTPLDYHNYFDDVKQPYPTPGDHSSPSPSPSPIPSPSPSSTPASSTSNEPQQEQIITQKPKYHKQSSPSYLQNYTPEIHYDSDKNLKYPVFNPTDYFAKTELTSQQTQPSSPANSDKNNYSQSVPAPVRNHYTQDVTAPVRNNYNQDVTVPVRNHYSQDSAAPVRNNYNADNNTPLNNNYNIGGETQTNTYKNEYNQNVDTQTSVEQDAPSEYPTDVNNLPNVSDTYTPSKYNDEHDSYQTNYDATESNPTSSSTTTTTTTRRTPQRNRGRPRYTTTPRSESSESTTKVVVTRRPLRERRPLPSRPRYEPNKITTEKPSKKPLESDESTTKSSRQRTRGRIHYRPSENEDIYDRRIKSHNTKEEDLAYQRDVLHQNYPVTLMERMSTVDIEAITEPTPKQTSERVEEPITENDTENAYTNEKVSIHYSNTESKEESALPTFTARSTLPAETSYVPNLPSTRQDYLYQSRSSIAPVESSAYDETSREKEEDIYVKQTTPVSKPEYAEINTYATETSASSTTEQSVSYSVSHEFATIKQEETTTAPETDDAKSGSLEEHQNEEEEENIVQTTPSYNRVRVRPGVIRQYHQASSTESSRNKERRRPAQPVTYRPAFDRRRTTMRIDEIEADLKTKQVHVRPEVQEVRHPVYRPEPTTEASAGPSSTTESTTKRGHFRRRRPSYSYTTTSTESPSTKRIYEVKNRFRGRRPTEKPTEKAEGQTEASTSTTRSQIHSRYSHRPRLSERYNKKPESEETEDQESNFSINRPKYVEPDTDQWSPKISSDSFKPYNPNDIVDEEKVATTERRSDKDSELDIITARNEFEDILLTVTPASNNRANKKIPDIPPTLEALVEQSKVTKSDSTDAMSTFESMLEEVMKSLEEQDEDEYTKNVMKHKGGEIGEIPPERIISSGDTYVQKSTTPTEETTTEQTTAEDSSLLTEDDTDRKSRRRGFWKKVKVRPATTESIEFAESQYYTHTVNRLGQPVKLNKNVHDKTERIEKPKVTTYKPSYSFIKDLFSSDDEASDIDVIPTVDIPKLTSKDSEKEETLITEESKQTTVYLEKETQTEAAISPGDLDLGTGSPDPTIDNLYSTTPTEPTTTNRPATVNRPNAGFSLMDYLFGTTSEDSNKQIDSENEAKATEVENQITTEPSKPKIITTETAFMPEEITTASINDDNTETAFSDIKKLNSTETSPTEIAADATEISVVKVESSSVSSFINPANVVSTSMSTEVSHETEICFRGKCIKTSKDIL